MTRRFFSFILYVLVLLLILGALLATLASYVLKDLKYYTEATLKRFEARTGYTIQLDDINWSLARGAGLQIENLSIVDARSQTQLLKVRKVHVLSSLAPLLRKRISVSRFILDEPEIHVVRTAEGSWHLPKVPPLLLDDPSGRLSAFNFALSLKRLYINSGRIVYDDNLRGATGLLERLNVILELDRHRQCYTMTANAVVPQGPSDGTIAFEARIPNLSADTMADGLYADGHIALRSLSLDPLAAYLQHLPFAKMRAAFDANISFSIRPGLHLTGKTRLTAARLSGEIVPGTFCNLTGSALQFNFQADNDSFTADSLAIDLPGGVNISGRCRLSDLRSEVPLFDMTLSSKPFSLQAIKKYCLSDTESLSLSRIFFKKLTGGTLAVDKLHFRHQLGSPWTFRPRMLQAAMTIQNAVLQTWEQLPDLVITEGSFNLETDRLRGTLNLRWPDSDNHTVRVDIPALFRSAAPEVSIESSVNVQSVARILHLFSQPSPAGITLHASDGVIIAHTCLWYQDGFTGTSDIDLTQAGYEIANLIAKPKAMANLLTLDWSSGAGWESAPLSFRLLFDKAADISGAITGWSPLSLQGTYLLNNLDLAMITFPSMPPAMLIQGILSGRGTFGWPALSTAQSPAEGSLAVKDFALIDRGSGAALISADLDALLARQKVAITAYDGRFGQTDGLAFSGTLSNILPPAGRLAVQAKNLDIDDFVNTVQRIDQLRNKQPQPVTGSQASIFRQIDLDMDLHVQKINFLKWNGDNATSSFAFKKGVMQWDNITIHVGPGTINGSVGYDFSHHPLRTLTLVPARSNVDFVWCVPQLRKGETITGTAHISGRFDSTFRRARDILPNMQGRFNIEVTDGEVKKFAFLSKILAMLNLHMLFELKPPDLMAQGMPFTLLSADFILQKRIMRTENLVMKGPAMNLSAVGNINLARDEIDMIFAAQPLETLGKIMGRIPVARDILTGKDSSLTIGYFEVKGPYDDAAVRPLPLKSLSKAVRKVFMTIFNIPRDIFSPHPKKGAPSD